MTGFETVVGLEVHCELRTCTKLFCGCRNAFGDEPNTNICPTCLGLPGSLPVLNRKAVELAVRIGTALNCLVQPSIFHRKNYFYPDMPKDYQISQYDLPVNVDGWLELPSGKKVGIVRAHMEEDTGKTTHVGGGGRIHEAGYSLVDYNRAGVPLVEIVSAPDLRSAEEAREYVEELRGILVATGASDGKMEEGSLRVDANVSVRPAGSASFGTRCEIKNLNSLRSLVRAITYEANRQSGILEGGGEVAQETRHWDEAAGRTRSLRSKEEAYDYRYFPEPDLVPLAPAEEWLASIRASLGVLPAERRQRVAAAAGVPASSEAVATVVRLGLDPLVTATAEAGADAGLALRRLANEVAGELGEARDGKELDVAGFVRLVELEAGGELTPAQARTVLRTFVAEGGDPAEIARRLGFEALPSGALAEAVNQVVGENPTEWQRYAAGDEKLAGFFLGKVKAATGGKADLRAAAELLRQRRALAGKAEKGGGDAS
jgi:aspartyl-tRNA(Asn)/glutamyl-tRNA(Gln) amidotransferase subunit B